MSKLTWDQAGERFYEGGVDRGVLYPPTGPGIPWNGLITVAVGATGNNLSAAYKDGSVVRMDVRPDDFVGGIKAFSSPREFAPCDGVVHLTNGLFVTQQPRAEFGLTYRTQIGNDITPTAGYKIHLIFNAKAAPATRENVSISKSPAAQALAWSITARPVAIDQHRATAHFVVSTLKNSPAAISVLENILYGTEVSAPRMPTVEELLSLST